MRSLLRRRLVGVLLVALLLAAASSVTLALSRPRPAVADGDSPAAGALRGAAAGLPLALSYDHRDLPASLDRARAAMTPGFARAFTAVFERETRAWVLHRRAVTDAVVRAGGVVRVGERSVLCLLYLDQRLRSGVGLEAGAPPRLLAAERVLVAMERRDGSWLVAGVRPVTVGAG